MAEVERRAIEAELPSVIKRLKSGASSAGVVSQRAFALEADRLGITSEVQRRRLRDGLEAVGIHVRRSRQTQASRRPAPVSEAAHHVTLPPTRTYASSSVAPQQVQVPSEAARRLAQARRMLTRYADSEGTVGKLAYDGVVRLHGLSPAEARELSADFPITRPRPLATSTQALTGNRIGPAAAGSPTSRTTSSRSPAGVKRARSVAAATDDTLSGAVRVARAVMEEDRWRRNPDMVLLKAEEEVGLAVLLKGGADRLDRDIPEEEIAALPRDGEQWRAYECLVRHNRRLVWKIALRYQGRGLDVDDLVQHGTIGLMRAVRKFDATKGYKLSTYATLWVRQVITRAIADEGTLIRVPVHMHEKVSKVAVAERKLLSEGRARTVDNVAYATGLTFAEVEEVRRISRVTDSLDRIIGDDAALGDLITGPCRLPGPDVVLIRKEFQERLRHILECFPERERHILIRRTGIDGGEPDTLEDIGLVFGVTRERIRQIESKVKAEFRGLLIRHRMVPSHR
ncbi:sigma-70 family RNA polymerase sigma factor [Streptomyces sp. NPDC054766]